MSDTSSHEEKISSNDQAAADQDAATPYTSSPAEEPHSSDQVDIVEETLILEVPSSEAEEPGEPGEHGERLDIGPGGVIDPDSPANRTLLERIERIRPLSPAELYVLAISYQKSISNSDIGNRLGFIGLTNIFQNAQRSIPELYPEGENNQRWVHQLVRPHQVNSDLSFIDQLRCGWDSANKPLPPEEEKWFEKNCPQARAQLVSARLVSYYGVRFIIEGTQIDETTTYVVLGVAPDYF